jgi:hypothetical protein
MKVAEKRAGMKAPALMILLLVLAVATPGAEAKNVVAGDSREAVIAALGQPQGILRDGANEMLLYPDQDVEMKNRRVVAVRRHNDLLADSIPDPAPAPSSRKPARAPAPAPAKPVSSPAQTVVSQPSAPVAKVRASPSPLALLVASRLANHQSRPLTAGGRVAIVAGAGLLLVGVLVFGAAWIWFLVRAFNVSVGWGLACLFLPFAPLVFLIKHWDEGGKPFLVSLAGGAGSGLGIFLLFTTAVSALAAPAPRGKDQPAAAATAAADPAPTGSLKLPPGVVQAGSLANEILIRDTMMAVQTKVYALGCDKPETIKQFYVVSLPTGPEGLQTWQEKWIVAGCGQEYPVDITFRLDGHGGAFYDVK